jgi:FKBP-type peptidyl-prolyl cis-trans isomerase SlpA
MRKYLTGFIIALSLSMVAGNAAAKDAVLIEDGKTVTMHFIMKSEGHILESTLEQEPFEFTLGKDPIFPGMGEAVLGLKAGDRKEFDLEPAEAFGERDPKGILEVPRANFGDNVVEVGMTFATETETGQPLRGMVRKVEGENVTLDFNHPLAGRSLQFEIEIIEVV